MANNWKKPEPLSDDEKKFIENNMLKMTDKKLSEILKRDLRTIRSARRKLGLKKTTSGKITSMVTEIDGKMMVASDKLNDSEREKIYKETLKNTQYFKALKQQFTEEELDFYFEEWGNLCVQFEDILATEKRQIDNFIKAEIYSIRMGRNIKNTEEYIRRFQDDIDQFRLKFDVIKDEEAQARDQELMYMLHTMTGQVDAMVKDYNENIASCNKILSDLNGRRRDRIDSIKKLGTTFQGLIQAFKDKQIREVQGRQLELVRLAKNQKLKEFRKTNKFPDGSKDAIVFDDKSELDDSFQNFIEKPKSEVIEKYNKLQGKRILVVDDDNERIQWFQDKLGTIDTATNCEKAISKLKENEYDLICLDYDIGMTIKGDVLAQTIISHDLSKNADVLIHSMNKDGAKKIFEILDGKRNTELYSFGTLLEAYRSKDAS